MHKKLKDTEIRALLIRAGLDNTGDIKRIEIGYSNTVYTIADRYILKIGRESDPTGRLEREAFFIDLLKDNLPTPEVLFLDTTRKIIDRPFAFFDKIHGDNLYAKWHEFSTPERKEIFRTILGYLRAINEAPTKEFISRFDINTSISWKEKIVSNINAYLIDVNKKQLLPLDFISQIRKYVDKNIQVLNDSKIALTYDDPHFDNFIVSNKKIVGVLDFETTDLRSIDYVLGLFKRMVDFPTKYVSAESEQYIKDEDYADLMIWCKEFYPELFDFKNLDIRLTLYSIGHDLWEYILFGNDRAKNELARCVGILQ